MYKVFFNYEFNKNKLKTILLWSLINFGQKYTINLVEELKKLGFTYATQAGISLGIDDLKTISIKKKLIKLIEIENHYIINNFKLGKITEITKYQELINNWQKLSEILKKNIIKKFHTINKLNPIYMMAFSGARGNISQVQQLIGMRGLMADPNGQIIHLPIKSNFREGLTSTEYLISCYGARKGVVDTALRTATAGYLTRRLVDTAQQVVICQLDCNTRKGIFLSNLYQGNKLIFSLKDQLLGRTLSKNIFHVKNKYFGIRNQQLDQETSSFLAKNFNKIFVRSALSCESSNYTLCQLCYGWNLSHARLVSLGEVVGVIAAQSIGEPGTQLTMRTFHTGGVFSGNISGQMYAPFPGIVEYSISLKGNRIKTLANVDAFLIKQKGFIIIHLKKQLEKNFKSCNLFSSKLFFYTPNFLLNYKPLMYKCKKFEVLPYTILFVKNKEWVKKNQLLANISTTSLKNNQQIQGKQFVTSKIEGEILFEDNFLLHKNKFSYSISKSKKKVWILFGKIYKSPINIRLFPQLYDYISYKFPITKVKIINNFSSFLKVYFVKKEFTNIISNQLNNFEIGFFREFFIYCLPLKKFINSYQKDLLQLKSSNIIENKKYIFINFFNYQFIFIPFIFFGNKNNFRILNNLLEQKNIVILSKSQIKQNNFNKKVLLKDSEKLFDILLSDSFSHNTSLFFFETYNNYYITPLSNFITKKNKHSFSIKQKKIASVYSSLNYNMNKVIKENLLFIEKKLFNIILVTSDFYNNHLKDLYSIKYFNFDNINNLFLHPITFSKYQFNTFLLKYINYKQNYYEISLNTWIKIKVNFKLFNKKKNNNYKNNFKNITFFQTNSFLEKLVLINFPYFLLTNFRINILYLKKFVLDIGLKRYFFNSKIINSISMLKFLLDFDSFITYKQNISYYILKEHKIKIGNIISKCSLQLIFHYFKNFKSMIIIERISSNLLVEFLNHNFFFYNFKDLSITNQINKLIYNNKLSTYLLEFYRKFFLGPSNYKLELNNTIQTHGLNINILDGWIYLPNIFTFKLLKYKKLIHSSNSFFDNFSFINKDFFIELFPIPKLLKEFSSYTKKMKFYNKSKQLFVMKYFCLNKLFYNKLKLVHNNTEYNIFHRKVPFALNLFKTNLKLLKKYIYLKFNKRYINIKFSINISFHLLIKYIKKSNYINQIYSKNKFLLKNYTINNYLLKQNFIKNFFSLDSVLFNKKRVTRLVTLQPKNIINTYFHIKVPILNLIFINKNTYFSKIVINNTLLTNKPLMVCSKIIHSFYGQKKYSLHNHNTINTKLKLLIVDFSKLSLYYNYSLINQIIKTSLIFKNNYWFNKNRVNIITHHLNWLPCSAIIAIISFLSPYEGRIINTKVIKSFKNFNIVNYLMIVTDNDLIELSSVTPQLQTGVLKVLNKEYFITKANVFEYIPRNGQLFSTLSDICPGKKVLNSGQIISHDYSQLIIRKGQSLLSSSNGIFYIWNNDFIKINDPLMTLLYKKLKTGDIVQGIPKIEYFFEARKTLQENENFLQNNLSKKLLVFFMIFKQKSTIRRAVQRSFAKIQKILIDGISRVYCSQGIIISRKHFEIIIRQMTSKVRVIDGGETGLLEGEYINLIKIENINNNLVFKRIIYEPLLLGITKASLKTESFISSASFQETTKVLSQSALERKIDFLNGLKENVILGRLIPGGTGLFINSL